MSHTSPASLLVWAILTCLVEVFLVFHLWSFDRFKCLKWNSGASSGAFKRVMTYSYILTVPLIAAYAIGLAAIKYHEGYVALPFIGVIPKPYQRWEPSARAAIFPLMLTFSIGWSLEMVTHLEELCFWLFLVNSGSAQRDWFHSLYFKTWMVGSTIAVIYMPLVAIFTRDDPLKSEAYIFLAGSLGSLSLTLWFTPILWTFPNFLSKLRSEGIDINTIVRLTKFSELNTIRVVFRFLFTVPLLILGVDGVRPHHHINENPFWTDFLAIIAGFGTAISSAITLVIFFPRSIEGEIASRDASRERKLARSHGTNSVQDSRMFIQSAMAPSTHTHISNYNPNGYNMSGGASGTYLLTSSPVRNHIPLEADNFDGRWDEHVHTQHDRRRDSTDKYWGEERDIVENLPPIRPNRRKDRDGGVELGGIDPISASKTARYNPSLKSSNANSMVHNFTSPIDLAYGGTQEHGSWLTFSRT